MDEEFDCRGERTYRYRREGSIFGGLFFLAGAFFQVVALWDIAAGVQIPVTIQHGHTVSKHFATAPEKVWIGFFPALFWGLGLFLLNGFRNYRLTTGEEGISVISWTGKRWSASWSDLRIVERRTNSYALSNGKNKAYVQNSMTDYEDLLADVRRHIPGAY